MLSGKFVPDDVMISMINKEIEAVGDKNWLLDGEWWYKIETPIFLALAVNV